MSKEKRFVIQVDPLEIEDDAIYDNKELKLYECQSGTMSDICSLLNKQDKQIADLEAKLAEKDKEISNLNGLIRERDKQIKNLKTNKKRVIEHKNKTKISFATEQLEKVKRTFIDVAWKDVDFAIEIIDNQIKELKEGK